MARMTGKKRREGASQPREKDSRTEEKKKKERKADLLLLKFEMNEERK